MSQNAALSPVGICHLPQHRLVPILLDAANTSGLCTVRYEHEVTRVEQSHEAATLHMQGPRGAERLRCKYVVACALQR